MIRRLFAAVSIAAMVSSAAGTQVTQTGSVFANGNWQGPTPTTTYNQSCNGGTGGIVGQYGTVAPYLTTVCASPPQTSAQAVTIQSALGETPLYSQVTLPGDAIYPCSYVIAASGAVSGTMTCTPSGFYIPISPYTQVNIDVQNVPTGVTVLPYESDDPLGIINASPMPTCQANTATPSGCFSSLTNANSTNTFTVRPLKSYIEFQMGGTAAAAATVTIRVTLKMFPYYSTTTLVAPSTAQGGTPGSFMPIGCEVRTALPSALSNAQAGRCSETTDQKILTLEYAPPELTSTASQAISNSTSPVTIAAAGGATVSNYVGGCQITWPTLGGATILQILQGASVVKNLDLPTVAGSMMMQFKPPLKAAVNTAITAQTTSAVSGIIHVNCDLFTAFP